MLIPTQLAIILLTVFYSGQEPVQKAGCGPIEHTNSGHPKDPPVIFGTPYVVPAFRIKILAKKTYQAVVGGEIIIRYTWRWVEFPRDNGFFDPWEDAYEIVRCVTNKEGIVEVPEYKVEPRGWYKGKFLFGRKPRFKNLEISVYFEKEVTGFKISTAELEEVRKGKITEFVETL